MLRLATRGSAQARTQAQSVADALMSAHAGLEVELVFIDTLGDQRTDVPLHTIGGQGVFVKSVQVAVLEGRADLAVHSAKDMPSAAADGLQIAAFCSRRDARDALIGASLGQLAQGATVATGSVRRRAQLQVVRPDLQFVELRGNIATRLSKLPEDGALVMAVAALEILGLTERIAEILPIDTFVPSPGQGCVAVECRADDDVTGSLLAAVDHAPTRAAVMAERSFLAELGTGCALPVAAHVHEDRLFAFMAESRLDSGAAAGRHVAAEVLLGGSPSDWMTQAAAVARQLRDELGDQLGEVLGDVPGAGGR